MCSFFFMQTMPVLLVALALTVGATTADALKQPKKLEYQNPVGRVVDLLKNMQKQIESEVKTDAASYDVQYCWCEDNRKVKVAEVNHLVEKEASLQTEVQEREAKDAELKIQVADAKAARLAAINALKSAEQIRIEAHRAIMAVQKSLTKNIASMNGAVIALKMKNLAFLPKINLLAIKTVLRNVAINYELMVGKNNGSHPLAGHIKQLRTAFLSVDSKTQSSEQARREMRVSRELVDALDVDGPAIGRLSPELAEKLLNEPTEEPGRVKSPSFLQILPSISIPSLPAPSIPSVSDMTGAVSGVVNQGASAVSGAVADVINPAVDMATSAAGQVAGGVTNIFGEAASGIPHSNLVFNTLGNMLEEMKNRFNGIRNTEFLDQENYLKAREAKKAEYDACLKTVDNLEDQETENLKKLDDARTDLEETTELKNTALNYLHQLSVMCIKFGNDYEQRSETRANELKAIMEALQVLREDDNREHLIRTTEFLQIGAARSERSETHEADLRRKAAASLRSVSKHAIDDDDLLSRWHSRHSATPAQQTRHPHIAPKHTLLGMLAVNTQLKNMTEVKNALDDMVAELKTKQADEVTFKWECLNKTRQNELDILNQKHLTEDEEATLDAKREDIAQTKRERDENIKARDDLKESMEKATANRDKQRAENNRFIQDQAHTTSLLRRALTKLKDFYESSSFVQQPEIDRTGGYKMPVGGFAPKSTVYDKHAAGAKVIQIIDHLVEQSEALTLKVHNSESAAQSAFETLVSDSAQLKDDLERAYFNKGNLLAQQEGEEANILAAVNSKKAALEGLNEEKQGLYDQCDWLLKNFNARQTQRVREMEGMRQAKAYLLEQNA